jgi:hypothetical protein
MNSRRRFVVEFDDLDSRSLTYTTSGPPIELLTTKSESGIPVVYASKGACRLLAETFDKLAFGNYSDGFHLHLEKDFDPDNAEVLRIILSSEVAKR